MRKLIPILFIFLTFSLLQFGQATNPAKKPKIGLLTFSVNAFDEESKKINASLTAVKDVIKKELEKNFQIAGEASDVITYSDIELPEVTIDPVVEPETNKKLERLCENDWDGLVFGHFHQEDKLVVVTRFYISKVKYPNINKNERIISSQEIEIPTTNLDNNSLGSHAVQAIEDLIKAIKTKRPEVFGVVNEEQPQQVTEAPGEETQPPQDVTGPTQTENETPVEADSEIIPLTAGDVYKMIVDKKFYCEIVTGSPFHGEGLKKFNIPKNGVFKEDRLVIEVKNNGLIRTENQSVGKTGDKITLSWSAGDTSKCYYKNALRIIETLNNKNKDKSKTWRIPTLMEVFSIVKEKTKNHFPSLFKFPPKTNLIFWTSTPVKKEGTSLEYDNANKAFFVVRSTYNKKTDNYSLSFSFQNIEGNNNKKSYLLPVYSDQVYTYKPSGKASVQIQSPGVNANKKSTPDSGDVDKIPGFDDPVKKTGSSPSTTKNETTPKKSTDNSSKNSNQGKIPGFDDVPSTPAVSQKLPKKVPSGSNTQLPKSGKSPARTLNIALFPFISKATPQEERKFLDDLNDKIMEYLNSVDEHLRENYNPKLKLKITKMKLSNINAIDGIYTSLVNNNATNDEKINTIKKNIMIPSKFDIILTVQHFYELKKEPGRFLNNSQLSSSGMHTFIPIIIDGIKNKIHLLNSNLQNKDRIKYDSIITPITQKIIWIIKSEFKKE